MQNVNIFYFLLSYRRAKGVLKRQEKFSTYLKIKLDNFKITVSYLFPMPKEDSLLDLGCLQIQEKKVQNNSLEIFKNDLGVRYSI